MKTWDVFISHASEDKKLIAKPLYDKLKKFGLTIWYDETEIEYSDDVIDKISYGLKNTKYFIIILSPDFIREDKIWTDAENNIIRYIKTVKDKKVIPIYYNIISDNLSYDFLPIEPLASIYTSKESLDDYSYKIAKTVLKKNLQNILMSHLQIPKKLTI